MRTWKKGRARERARERERGRVRACGAPCFIATAFGPTSKNPEASGENLCQLVGEELVRKFVQKVCVVKC